MHPRIGDTYTDNTDPAITWHIEAIERPDADFFLVTLAPPDAPDAMGWELSPDEWHDFCAHHRLTGSSRRAASVD